MYFSKSTLGFYDRAIHGDDIPRDAVEITATEYQDILHGQSAGLVIVAGKNGKPDLVEPAVVKPTAEQVERARLAAYSDKITGSDRFQIEAAAERLAGNEEAAKEAERKWLARRAEIAAENPWPEAE